MEIVEPVPPVAVSTAARIVRARRELAGFFIVLSAVVAYKAPELFENVQDEVGWDVIEGTKTADAQTEFTKYFPDMVGSQTESILISCSRCNSLVHGSVADLVEDVIIRVNQTLHDFNETKGWIQQVRCYYDWVGVVDPLPNPLLSGDQRTMLYQWRWKVPAGGNVDASALTRDALKFGTDALSQQAHASEFGVSIFGGGPFATHRDVAASNVKDCGQHSVAFLPVGLAILGIRVGSCTMMILPVLVGIGATLSAFATVAVIAQFITVNAYAPTLMTFFSLALSVDYCLILLTRYQEERRAGATVRPALENMLNQNGMVVLSAGCLLSAATLSIVLLPGSFVGMALAISITPISCMLWSLLLLPTFIGSFPWLFDDCAPRSKAAQIPVKDMKRMESCVASYDLMTRHLVRSPWFWWSSKVTVWPCNIIVVCLVLAGGMPLTWTFVSDFVPSIDVTAGEPRGAASTFANQMIRDKFAGGIGNPSPIFLLVKPQVTAECPATVKSNAFFKSSCAFAQKIILETAGTNYQVKSDNIFGVTFHPKTTTQASSTVDCLPYEDDLLDANPDAKSLLTGNGLFTGLTEKMRGVYIRMWNSLVSQDEDAMVFYISPRLDASSPEGYKLIEKIRNMADHIELPIDATEGSMCNVDAYLLSHPSAVKDFAAVTLDKFKGAFCGAVLGSFLLVGIMFGAVFLPFKLFITVAMPIVWANGLVVLIYQYGLLNSLKIPSLEQTSGLGWQTPVFTCSLLFGLGLDYDILLFSRIWELRCDGYSNLDSIRLGVASSGGVIVAAGVIFVLELTGGLMSPITAINQFIAVIIIAVLIDITVVETCFVPALLSLRTDLNWWPVRMPPPTKTIHDYGATPAADVRISPAFPMSKDAESELLLKDYQDLSQDTSRTSESTERSDLPYSKGETVQVWSNTKNKWLSAEILEAFDRPCFTEGYAVKAGTFKVRTARGEKWVAPERVSSQIQPASSEP